MTKQEKLGSLEGAMTQSERSNGVMIYRFTDDAPEELRDLFLEHFNVSDTDYEILNDAVGVVIDVYDNLDDNEDDDDVYDNLDDNEDDDDVSEAISEAATDCASVYTAERLGYMNNRNQDEISDVMREYSTHDIATACAIWYDQQVENAANIISKWVND